MPVDSLFNVSRAARNELPATRDVAASAMVSPPITKIDLPGAVSSLDRLALSNLQNDSADGGNKDFQHAAVAVRKVIGGLGGLGVLGSSADRNADLSAAAGALRQKYVLASSLAPKDERILNRLNRFNSDKSPQRSRSPSASVADCPTYDRMCTVLRGAELKEVAQAKLAKEMAKHPAFEKFPADNAWRLLMDADRQLPDGDYAFENESGYMGGAMNGFRRMLETLHTPITADLLEELHDTCVDQVWRTGSNEINRPGDEKPEFSTPVELLKGYRGFGTNSFDLSTDFNLSKEGLTELLELARTDQNFTLTENGRTIVGPWVSSEDSKHITEKYLLDLAAKDVPTLFVKTAPNGRGNCRDTAQEIIGRYEAEIKQRKPMTKSGRPLRAVAAISRSPTCSMTETPAPMGSCWSTNCFFKTGWRRP